MLQKLWVAHKTDAKKYGPVKVSFEGCDDVDDFLKRLYTTPLLAISQNTPITLYQPNGTTEIGPTDTITSLGNAGQDGGTPLVVKTTHPTPTSKSPGSTANGKADFELYSWEAKKYFKVITLQLDEARIPLKALLLAEHISQLSRIDFDGDVLLLADMDGFSIQRWTNGQTYKLRVSPNEKATFQLYSWKAKKRPFKVITLQLDEARIPLKTLLQAENITHLYQIDVDGEICLLADEDGFSVQKWTNGQTYKLRVKSSTSVDIEITFSEKDHEKMNILSVRDDFSIKFEKTPWLFSGDSIEVPVALTQTLALFAQFNTLRLEASRRSIVSVFLHFAISTVSEGKSKLCIDEETPLAITRNVDRNGELKTVRYSGPVDFVIGHSKMQSNMPRDAAVMAIETKKSETFDRSLSQVVAQAAALLYYRRGVKPPRGLEGSGGPIVFIRTDGERWIFSKMTCKEGVPIVQHSNEFNLDICQNNIQNDTVQQVFNWITHAITIGRDSSPRASFSQVVQNQPDEQETLDASFSDLQIYPE